MTQDLTCIVILLQVNTTNKRRETPVSCAQNLHLAFLLKRASSLESQKSVASFASPDDPFASFLTQKFSDNDEDINQKVSRVFKAIKVGDVPLVAFYFGIERVRETAEVVECHPFCDCVKCRGQSQVWNLEQTKIFPIFILCHDQQLTICTKTFLLTVLWPFWEVHLIHFSLT